MSITTNQLQETLEEAIKERDDFINSANSSIAFKNGRIHQLQALLDLINSTTPTKAPDKPLLDKGDSNVI